MLGSKPAAQQSLQDWEGVQGGIVVPLRVGHPVHVHGVVSRGATAETPKNTLCELVVTSRCGKQGAPATRPA